MRKLFLILFPLFLIILGIYGAGSSLPEQTTTIRGVQLPIAQEELFGIIRDIAAMPKWHDKIEEVTAIPDPQSKQTLWHVRAAEDRSYVLKVAYVLEPEILKLQWLENSLPYTAEWDITLTDKTPVAAEEGEAPATPPQPETFIKIVEIAKTSNPFARFYMQYIVGYEGELVDYLHALARQVNAPEAEIRELVA